MILKLSEEFAGKQCHFAFWSKQVGETSKCGNFVEK
jgi:hypothetical protein